MSSIKIIEVNWPTHEKVLSAIRREVFILEQNVPEELEWDGLDENSYHVLAQVVSQDVSPQAPYQAIGTGRLLLSSQTDNIGHVGRMAIRQEYRRRGVGKKILQFLIELANRQGFSSLFLHAQVYVVEFYQQAGFSVEGKTFMDAGIPHVRMILKL